jgi:hypothetical protein
VLDLWTERTFDDLVLVLVQDQVRANWAHKSEISSWFIRGQTWFDCMSTTKTIVQRAAE